MIDTGLLTLFAGVETENSVAINGFSSNSSSQVLVSSVCSLKQSNQEEIQDVQIDVPDDLPDGRILVSQDEGVNEDIAEQSFSVVISEGRARSISSTVTASTTNGSGIEGTVSFNPPPTGGQGSPVTASSNQSSTNSLERTVSTTETFGLEVSRTVNVGPRRRFDIEFVADVGELPRQR